MALYDVNLNKTCSNLLYFPTSSYIKLCHVIAISGFCFAVSFSQNDTTRAINRLLGVKLVFYADVYNREFDRRFRCLPRLSTEQGNVNCCKLTADCSVCLLACGDWCTSGCGGKFACFERRQINWTYLYIRHLEAVRRHIDGVQFWLCVVPTSHAGYNDLQWRQTAAAGMMQNVDVLQL